MRPLHLKLAGLLVLLAIFGVAWLSSRRSASPSGEVAGDTIRSQEGSTELVTDQAAVAENIVEQFTSAYITTVSWQDEKSAAAARELLTQRGKNVMDAGNSPLDGLQRFTGYLPAPEQVVVSESHKRNEQFAEVIAQWQYPVESTTRYFYFTIEEGAWKLDSIQTVRQ